MAQTIPDLIHFVFGLGDSPEEFLFCWHAAVLSAALINRPQKVVFHYHHEPLGPWWHRTREIPGLELRLHRSVPSSVGGMPLKQRAHRADVLRLEILWEEGGVYMDTDTITARPYASLARGREFVIGLQAPEEPPRGRLCNAIMMAKPRSPFVRAWLEAYPSHFDPDGWGEASIDLPYRLYEELGPERCSVAPTEAFLWPPWYKVRQIFQTDTPVPEGLVTLHLWVPSWRPSRALGAWADRNRKTLYGRLLARLRDLAEGSAGPAAPVSGLTPAPAAAEDREPEVLEWPADFPAAD